MRKIAQNSFTCKILSQLPPKNITCLFFFFCDFLAICIFKSITRGTEKLETMSVEGAGQVQRCLWENLLFPWVEQRFLLQAKGQLGSGPASPSQDKDGSIDTSWKIRLPSCFPTHFLSPSLKETGTTLTEAMFVRNSVSICQCSEHKLI